MSSGSKTYTLGIADSNLLFTVNLMGCDDDYKGHLPLGMSNVEHFFLTQIFQSPIDSPSKMAFSRGTGLSVKIYTF